ncbi:putative cupredoxin [Medicago truncatula]|uniref:Plastocyanin-like domain protein n=1 Tax=Medicago truncatula TaxID=3880 RepID=G7I883_MEDTR|nr:early nodulin-like protein 1 [Medicago truncatula]AES59115.1 plastocyanin-like domain protein [Medicago truncatula]RHN77010.1 putative cupredoxin [Medicago truncatula]
MAGSSSCSLLVLFVLFGCAFAAKDILLGGKTDAWKVPSSESDSLNKWASSVRFQVGDHLILKYEAGKDSVLQVSKEDYDSCNISKPIKHYNDGNTKVRFDHSGPYYYISGEKGHCEKGQKLTVVVMSLKGGSRPIVAFSPSPSPAEVEGPAASAVAPAPTSGAAVLQGGGVFVAVGVFVAMWLF